MRNCVVALCCLYLDAVKKRRNVVFGLAQPDLSFLGENDLRVAKHRGVECTEHGVCSIDFFCAPPCRSQVVCIGITLSLLFAGTLFEIENAWFLCHVARLPFAATASNSGR